MKWKKWTNKLALMFSLMLLGCLVVLPGLANSAEPSAAKVLASLESISSDTEGSSTVLNIKLSEAATYTSYKTTSPLRFVIDLSQVVPGTVSTPLIINKGNFKAVTTSRFDTDAGVLTRVEIELEKDCDAAITASPSNPGELKVTCSVPSDFIAKPKDSPVAAAAPATATEAVANHAGEAVFRTLTAITVSENTIMLATDGQVTEFKTFRLNKPERYVVDLINVKSGLSAKLLPLNASGIASARIGLYPDKVRIVLDAVNGSFPDATAVKTDSGVVITLDVKKVDENANTKLTSTRSEKPAEAPVTKPVEAVAQIPAVTDSKPKAAGKVAVISTSDAVKKTPGVAVVENVDFQVIDGISRVSVKVNGDVKVDPPVKTPGFVTLTIKDATISKNQQRTLDARSFISPVLRVTPMLVKSKKGVETKIRIATRISSPFEFRHEADMIFVDFKNSGVENSEKLVIEATNQTAIKAAQQKSVKSQDEEITNDLSWGAEPAVKSSVSAKGYKGRKVTLEFADAEVRKIFQLLSEVSNKNFVLGDEVTGAISLKLVNVPWDQALDIILDTKGLDKREDGNIILIKGKGKFKSQADEELELKKALAKGIELKTETFSVNYSDVATISSQFAGLKSDRGIITVDARTGSVIVKDVPMALEDMRKLLKQLDVPERQVMIEARIIEATSTFTRSLGVNWGMHAKGSQNNIVNNIDSTFGGLASVIPVDGTSTAKMLSGQPGAAMGIAFAKLAGSVALDMRLNAAASAGLIKIISSPKVATINHKTAKISQGQQIPYQNTTATTGAVTAFVAATLSLDVTPNINSNGTIVMKIDAKNDAPGTGSPPPINTKQATTELLLKDGETTVIGGIYVDSEQDGDDGVPYLMDIPFIGNLFKSKTKTKIKTELLIFITPRILN